MKEYLLLLQGKLHTLQQMQETDNTELLEKLNKQLQLEEATPVLTVIKKGCSRVMRLE